MEIKIKKMHADAKLPSYGHPGDAGLDLYSREETLVVNPGERKLFSVGFALEFPHGYMAIVKDKSSLSVKNGLHAIGGIFDAGFRGEYNVCLANLSNESTTIEKGQKVAQLLIVPVIEATLTEVEELGDSSRGLGQFGSTGKF